MKLKEYAQIVLNDVNKLTIAEMAELIIANGDNDFEIASLKKSLSINTTKWKGFVREKIDGKVYVSLKNQIEEPVKSVGETFTFCYDGKVHTANLIKRQGALVQVGGFKGYPDGKWIKANMEIK